MDNYIKSLTDLLVALEKLNTSYEELANTMGGLIEDIKKANKVCGGYQCGVPVDRQDQEGGWWCEEHFAKYTNG